jgi:hypothetical protein
MPLKKPLFQLLVIALVAVCFSIPAGAQAEKKLASGILIDNTGSLRTQFEIVLDVSRGIVEQTYRRGPVSLFPFKNETRAVGGPAVVTSDVEWSQDKDDLESSLDSLYIVPGETTLMDGISSVAKELNAKVNEDKDAFAAKMIFLVTDGEDRSSKINEKDLIKLLKDSGIQVFAVGLVHNLDSEGSLIGKSAKGKSVSFLEKITKETGGRVVFAKTKSDNPQTLLKALFEK